MKTRSEATRAECPLDRPVGRQPRRQVLHKQIYRRNAFGGTTNTTLCGRMKLMADGNNMADTDAEVTCKFCLHKMHLPPNAQAEVRQ